MPSKFNYCRVCGLDCSKYGNKEPPWGEGGTVPSYDICLCCGVEFGYEDFTLEGVKKYRNEWLQNGAQWLAHKYKPENWSLEEQLKNIPDEFL